MSTSLKETPAPGSESSPLVAVIIITYNRCTRLERAIDSVLRQTFTDFELIVVDDGSNDGTTDLLDSYDWLRNCLPSAARKNVTPSKRFSGCWKRTKFRFSPWRSKPPCLSPPKGLKNS